MDKLKRPPNESGCPPELECLIGHAGPYIRQEKAEFHHIDKDVQQWLIRMDAEELALQRLSLKLSSWVRSAGIWAKRMFWAFTVGLGGVLAAGEKLAKLPETMQSAWSGVSSTLHMLSRLFH